MQKNVWIRSNWQNIKFSRYCPKFLIVTKIVIFQGCLQLFRSTASSLWILWQGHVRNTLFHFCQLWVFPTCLCHKIYRDEAVGLKSCKHPWKITIFVKIRNLGQYKTIQCLITCIPNKLMRQIWLQKFLHVLNKLSCISQYCILVGYCRLWLHVVLNGCSTSVWHIGWRSYGTHY